MNTLKRVLAIAALALVAVTILAFLVVLIQGQLMEKLSWVLVPASGFLMVGLIALAINWLQKIKTEAAEDRAKGAQK